MSNQADLEQLINSDYDAGFVTNIESDTLPPGLNEDVIRFISNKKEEPEWVLQWRLDAYAKWQKMTPPDWAQLKYPPVDFNAPSYYSSPKSMKTSPKA